SPSASASLASGAWTLNRDIAIDLGSAGEDVGVSIDGKIHVDSTLTADLTAGLTTDTVPAGFLVPSAGPADGLNVGVHASVTGLNAALTLGFLSASITGGSIDFTGTVHIGLADPDDSGNEITLTELTNRLTSNPASLVSVPTPTSTFTAVLPVSVAAGVKVGGTDLLNATLGLALPAGANIF